MAAELKDGVEAGSGQVETGLAVISVPGADKASPGASPWASPVASHLLPTVAGSSVRTHSTVLSHPEMYTPSDDMAWPRPCNCLAQG